MKRLAAFLVALVALFSAAPASAQATRTWVSGVGDDANPCSRTAPCKTFAGAISKTAAGGEINVLDSGGFGAINITKSITIDGAGAHASILAVGTNGVIINGAGIVVTLRNLSINGAGSTTGNGIRILNAASVNIDNVVIENFGGIAPNGRGISIETAVAGVRVTVTNSRFYNNNSFAIQSNPTAGTVSLALESVELSRGGATAVFIRGNTAAAINRSSITNYTADSAVIVELASSSVNISNSLLANNAVGVLNGLNGGTPTTRLYGNVITGNTTGGLVIIGGSIISLGNNMIRGNAGNEVPSSTIGTQ